MSENNKSILQYQWAITNANSDTLLLEANTTINNNSVLISFYNEQTKTAALFNLGFEPDDNYLKSYAIINTIINILQIDNNDTIAINMTTNNNSNKLSTTVYQHLVSLNDTFNILVHPLTTNSELAIDARTGQISNCTLPLTNETSAFNLSLLPIFYSDFDFDFNKIQNIITKNENQYQAKNKIFINKKLAAEKLISKYSQQYDQYLHDMKLNYIKHNNHFLKKISRLIKIVVNKIKNNLETTFFTLNMKNIEKDSDFQTLKTNNKYLSILNYKIEAIKKQLVINYQSIDDEYKSDLVANKVNNSPSNWTNKLENNNCVL